VPEIFKAESGKYLKAATVCVAVMLLALVIDFYQYGEFVFSTYRCELGAFITALAAILCYKDKKWLAILPPALMLVSGIRSALIVLKSTIAPIAPEPMKFTDFLCSFNFVSLVISVLLLICVLVALFTNVKNDKFVQVLGCLGVAVAAFYCVYWVMEGLELVSALPGMLAFAALSMWTTFYIKAVLYDKKILQSASNENE
jgi:hypothetical protein